MTEPIGITLSLDGVQKFEADGRRAAGTVDSIGVSAKQTAAALRGVPAQFTDIITSLQGGQAPLTVLLQQGGQLKDMFGGVGAAAKGLGGYVAGLVNPFSMAAAAAVGVAVAYKQGSAEADSYRAALITTGNAAGATAAQMQQMAGRIGAIVGTQGAAADALAQMAGSGRVAAQNFEYFGEVALKTEKSIGTAVSETVKQFAELGKSPVEASRKLNEETNYLTAAIYEQIKALKDQGRDADAAALAQKTYADALNGRSAQMTQNLGVIEKAWQGITGAAKGAWDAMLNVGRQDTLATKMDDVRAKIAQAQGQDKNRRFSLPWDTPLAELQQQLSYLSEEERMLRRGAEAQAARTQAEKAAIDAADALRKTQEKGLTKQQQMNKALEEYRRQLADLRATNPDSELLSSKSIARGEKSIRDQFKETGSRSGAQANAYAAEQEAAKVWAKTLKDVEKGIADVEEKTLGLNKAQAALLEYISSPAYATNSEEMRQAALARLYAWDAAIKNADGIKAEKAAMEQASKAMATWFDARSKDASALTSQVQARREEVAAMGLSADAVSRLSAAKYEQAAAEQEAYAAALKSAKLYAGEYAQAYDAAAQDALDQAKRLRELGSLDLAKGQKQAALDAEAEWKRTSDSINQSLTDALLRGFESGKDFAKNLRDTVVNMFKTMVLRPVISAIVNPVAGAITGALGFSGAAQAGQGGGLLGTALQGAQLYQGLTGGTGLLGSIGSALGLGAASAYSLGGAAALGASTGVAAGGGLGLSLTGGGLGISAPAAGYFGGVSSGVAGGAAASGGGMSGALASIPGWGWALAGLAALAAIFGKKSTPHMGAASTYSESGGLVSNADIYRSSGLADTRTYNAEVAKVTGGVAKGVADTLNATARAFGKTAGYEITTAFADDKSKDGAWGSLIIRQAGKSVIDWRDTQTSKWAPKEFADGEAGQKEYMAAIAKSTREALDAMDLPGWADDMLNALGETPSLEGLASTVESINAASAALDTMGKNLVGFAGLTDEAISALVKASGGMAGLISNASTFYDNFYSPEEKRDRVKRDITDRLSKAGITGIDFDDPKARDKYRKLVEDSMAKSDEQAKNRKALAESFMGAAGKGGKSLSELIGSDGWGAIDPALTGGGKDNPEARKKLESLMSSVDKVITSGKSPAEIEASLGSLIDMNAEILGLGDDAAAATAALLGASGAFASVTQSAEEARAEAQASALNSLQRAVEAEKRLLDARIDAASTAVSELSGLFGLLHDNVRSLYGEVDSTAAMMAAQGNAFIAQALSAARSTGYLPEQAQLNDAISAARGGIGATQYATQFEADRARLVLAGQLSELEGMAGEQLGTAERTLKELQAQSDQLDATLQYWRDQIELSQAGVDATLSVADAVAHLEKLMFPEADKPAGGGSGGGAGSGAVPVFGGSGAAASTANARYKTPIALGTAGVGYQAITDSADVARLDKLAPTFHKYDGTGNLAGLAADIKAAGGTAKDLAALYGFYESDVNAALDRAGIPRFDVGINRVPYDMTARIHKDEAVLPARFNPFNPGSQQWGGGNAELVAEVRALREEVALLRAAAKTTADNTNGLPQLVDQFDNVTSGGNAMREAVA